MKFFSFSTGLIILFCMCRLTQSAQPQMSGAEMDDFNLTTVEIIEKYGYPAEIHKTVSEDGYILELHRIPHGKNSTKPGFPILLAHSFLFDSAVYLLNGEKSVGFLLADQGYDVWLINFRGNHYTRTHKDLSPEDSKFWDFSFHEFGVYDIPAFINYICNYTKNEDILYLGYSMGTTSFLVFGSERPEYHKNIRGAVLLGPVAILKHSTSALRFGRFPSKWTEYFFKPHLILGNIQESATLQKIKFGCNSTKVLRDFCYRQSLLLSGFDINEVDHKTILTLISHISGTSAKVLRHYFQLFLTDDFRQYDYGVRTNLIKYKSLAPPKYHLESITIPISLVVGLNDVFATPENTRELTKRLRSVKSIFIPPQKSFNHNAYLIGKYVEETVYPEVARRLKEFQSNGEVTPE